MRAFRLILGIAIIIQSFIARDIMFVIAGLLLTGMAILNIGCCGSAVCNASPKKYDETTKDSSYEEVV